QERSKAVDYRSYVGLYCLYGEGELLYVGEAGLETGKTLFDRIKRHRTGPLSGRWDRFSWFGRADCTGSSANKTAIGQLEAIAIAIINPGFNKQSGTFVQAVQVYQVPHEKAEGNMETKISRLADQFSQLISNKSK